MRGAGCTWNDITDRDIDGSVARTASRPIPAGQVSVRGALAWMVAQALVAFCHPADLQLAAIALGMLALLPVCDLSLCQALHLVAAGLSRAGLQLGRLLAWTAHTGRLGGRR